MNRLLKIGFQCVGRWKMVDGNLEFELTSHEYSKNVLYAFVSNGEIKYIGKTVQDLRSRMQGYKSPGKKTDKKPSTNYKNKLKIESLLKKGEVVDIFVLPDNGLMHYGDFHLNLAAGLEDSLISVISPPWNGKNENSKEKNISVLKKEVNLKVEVYFDLILEKTYYNQGFFNVKRDYSKYFGNQGEQIEVYVFNKQEPLMGYINRDANKNKSPRIMVGKELRDWFQNNFEEKEKVKVGVISPVSIIIHK